MSTKSTIVHGGDFHFYEDLIEDTGDPILEIHGPSLSFEVSPDHIRISIPREIMDQIAEAWSEKRLDEVFTEEIDQ